MSVRGAIAIQRESRLRGIPVDRLFRKWLLAALPKPAELSLRIVNAAEGRQLNHAYRRKDYATNVLTFVYHEAGAKVLSGDIVLCAPVVAREAREQGKSLDAHYAHLTVHGALHLAGMDHETAREAKVMETLEIDILSRLGYANPYE
jgi:probable rRNA maturation factor